MRKTPAAMRLGLHLKWFDCKQCVYDSATLRTVFGPNAYLSLCALNYFLFLKRFEILLFKKKKVTNILARSKGRGLQRSQILFKCRFV